jgi:hypothetical protein
LGVVTSISYHAASRETEESGSKGSAVYHALIGRISADPKLIRGGYTRGSTASVRIKPEGRFDGRRH